nr:hypothetical protein LTR18_000003 [Exophiala xenobiotica]
MPIILSFEAAVNTSEPSVLIRADSIESPLNTVSTPGEGITVPRVLSGATKLNNLTEGYLLRHFGRVLGPWLANTTETFSPETADYYHGRCIEILIPLLSDPDLHQEMDVILASIVILRLEEQISCVKHEHDFQHHLSGGSAFFNSGVDWYVAGGLTEASFWAFAMQDIQFSLAWQTPLRLCFETFDDGLERMWLSQSFLTEKHWAHRAIWLLAETVQYCLAEQGDKSKKEWDRIDGRLDEWEKSRPQAFAPFFYRAADPGDANPLPTIWFSSPLHVQHICMARAILITCDPSRPKFGLNHGKFQRRQQEQVLEYLKVLFGAAASCEDAAARHMIPICLCASYYWISGRNLQRQLLDLVNVVGQETGWFWNAIIEDIKREWAW